MKKVIFIIIVLILVPINVSANIMCNDGTMSPSCSSCSPGCCSHHSGCAKTTVYSYNYSPYIDDDDEDYHYYDNSDSDNNYYREDYDDNENYDNSNENGFFKWLAGIGTIIYLYKKSNKE